MADDDARIARLVRTLVEGGRLDATQTIRLDEECNGSPPVSLPIPTRRRAMLPHLDLGEGDSELRVERLLGRGGMGRVELVRQRSLDREVAVKRPLPEHRSAAAAQALLREGIVTGQL